MARICLIIALIGGIVSGLFGYLLSGQKKDYQGQAAANAAQLSATKTLLQKTGTELKTTLASLDDTKGKLTEVTSRAESLEKDLGTAKTKVSALEQQVQEAQQKVTSTQTQLTEITARLGTESTAAQQAQAKLSELDKQKRILDDDLARANAEVARLKDIKERSKNGTLPPGITGRIVSINRNWNFVVLNIGDKVGLVENGELVVYRQKEFIGRIRVVSTEANTAVADIIIDSLKGDIQVGDDVLN